MKTLNVIIGCEANGRVREAFRARGHNAWSCDLLPTRKPGQHIHDDLLKYLGPCAQNNFQGWDLAIFHPPCTYLCSSGLHWNGRVPGRAEETEKALHFVAALLNSGIPKIALENSVGCISTRIAYEDGKYIVLPAPDKKRGIKATQIIQPYNFGEDASKSTALWLVNLPPLTNTSYFQPRMVCKSCKAASSYDAAFGKGCPACGAEPGLLQPRWSNQTDSGQNRLGPSEERGMMRSVTYQGIADAFAAQWG